MRLPSVSGIYDLRLPYMRFAFPQVIVPVVFAYLGLQTRALKSGSKGAWVGMALLQFAACCAFPYVLPIVAVATAITILIIECYSRQKALRWPTPLLFAAACGVLDIGYLLLAGLATSHGNIQFGLHFRPEMIIPSMRPYVLLLLIGAGLALASPSNSCGQGHGCGTCALERIVCLFRCALSCNEPDGLPRQLHCRPYLVATPNRRAVARD